MDVPIPIYVAVSNPSGFEHVVFVKVVALAPMIPKSTQPNCVLRPKTVTLSRAIVGWRYTALIALILPV